MAMAFMDQTPGLCYNFPRMQKYELTVIFPGDVNAAKVKTLKGKVEGIVKSLGGKVVKSDDWGKKDLFHTIENFKSGVFLHYQIELAGSETEKISLKFKLEKEILRHLLVKID